MTDKTLLFMFCSLLTLLAGGCVSNDENFIPDYSFQPQEADKLTPAELNALTAHARAFISKSKRLPLVEGQRRIIATTPPTVVTKYYGRKFGQIRMSWRVASNAVLELYGTGQMTQEKFPWRVRISASDGTHQVPENMRENVDRITP